MTEPFNIEKFRQQMRGQAPARPQVQPQPVPQQMPPHIAPPPMPQHYAAQQQPQPQAIAQPYGQPVGGQPQVWPQQGQPMPAPQMMQPQAGVPPMQQAPVFAPPPSAMAQEMMEETTSKKSRFSLKRSKKEKAPKVKKVKKDKGGEAHETKRSPAMIFMLGMATGMACLFAGNMVMSSVFAKEPAQNLTVQHTQNTSVQQDAAPVLQALDGMEPIPAAEE